MSAVIKGPPKFAALRRTAVVKEADVPPTEAQIAQDFSLMAPMMVQTADAPAPLPTQQARLAAMDILLDGLGTGRPAKVGVPSIVAPEGSRAEAVTTGKPKRTVVVAPVHALGEPLVAKPPEPVPEEGVKIALDKVVDAAHAIEIQPATKELIEHVTAVAAAGPKPPLVKPDGNVFVPENRKVFKHFLIHSFSRYMLPPQSEDPDPEACTKQAKASSKELKTFQYQAFVRDYLQRASPYRGLLVFHGLGSGKTCTSIAAAEALYGAGNRKIIVMTPASLSGNYRGEMTKCGYFAFQNENYWTWLPVNRKAQPVEFTFLTETLGLPPEYVVKKKGGWVPDPTLPSNWDVKSAAERAQISAQIDAHIRTRFMFINYNGLSEKKVREWACKTPRMFDGAVVIIDEIHNLIRTINNSNLENFYEKEPLAPVYEAKQCMTGKKYRIGYLVYRLLTNAIGAKIVALSGTPIINYPQELGILANILSGDMRFATAILPPTINIENAKIFFNRHPEVDLVDIVSADGGVSLRITPVPSGYRKVVTEAGEVRGFIRDEDAAATAAEIKREIDMAAWLTRVDNDFKTAMKSAGSLMSNKSYGANQRLPDIEKSFVETFIDKESLTLSKPNDLVLTARLSGLVSYYKAGKPELVARVEKDVVEYVDMSDRQLEEYTIVRQVELKQEDRDRKKGQAPVDARYELVVKSQKGTFKIFSRAACNFAFPDDIPRPRPGDLRLAVVEELGEAKSEGTDADILAEGDQELLDGDEVAPDAAAEEAALAAAPKAEDPYKVAIRAALDALRARGPAVFSVDNLKTYSPKFQKVIDNIETAKGPVLVYSNFKTLEGLGIFGMALELQKDYIKFDITPQANGLWALSPELLVPANASKKRYIAYTGDEKAEKRDILKHIFNANWQKIPKELGLAVRNLAGAENNINGKIAMAFMITQSGAEGISLENVRQVHLMEPYWNYVRLEQVKGRAIRICSHKMLPYEERTVEVFTYISKFSEAQKTGNPRKVDKTLTIKDDNKSSDETIFAVSTDKRKLSDSLFGAMKAAAVDCELNANENGRYACYRFDKPSMEPIFHPNLVKDILDTAAAARLAGAPAPGPAPAPAAQAEEPKKKARGRPKKGAV